MRDSQRKASFPVKKRIQLRVVDFGALPRVCAVRLLLVLPALCLRNTDNLSIHASVIHCTDRRNKEREQSTLQPQTNISSSFTFHSRKSEITRIHSHDFITPISLARLHIACQQAISIHLKHFKRRHQKHRKASKGYALHQS